MNRVAKFLAHEGRVSLVVAHTTEMVEEIRNIHDLTPTTTAAMGRFATITGMMGFTEIKDSEDYFTAQINGQGPMGTMISVVRREEYTSKVKVCVDNPHVEVPLKENGKLDVSAAVGNNGFLNIINKSEATDTNYNGLVPLVTGEIAEDFANYFQTSEQRQTAVALGVLVDKDGVRSSGGYIISPMPDATEEEISIVEQSIFKAGAISKMLDNNLSLKEIAQKVTGDENVKVMDESIEPVYECECNKEKFAEGLMTLGKDQLTELIEEDGKAEIQCQFCNQLYNFNKEELEEILKNVK